MWDPPQPSEWLTNLYFESPSSAGGWAGVTSFQSVPAGSKVRFTAKHIGTQAFPPTWSLIIVDNAVFAPQNNSYLQLGGATVTRSGDEFTCEFVLPATLSGKSVRIGLIEEPVLTAFLSNQSTQVPKGIPAPSELRVG